MPTIRELEEMTQDYAQMEREHKMLPTCEEDAKMMLMNAMLYLGIDPVKTIIKKKETHA